MHYKQLLWLSSLIAVGIVAVTISVTAEANQSDTSASQTYSAPAVHIDSQNGNGIPETTQYDPVTGTVSGGILDDPINLGSSSGSASAVGSGSTNDDPESASASGSGDGSGNREVTLNEVAELLENNLEQSLDNLAAAEDAAKLQDAGPRRIVRRSSIDETRECINPAFHAREILESQLNESEKFIKQVNQIEPEKNIW